MENIKTLPGTEDYGFDFCTVYSKSIEATSSTANHDDLPNCISNVSSNNFSFNESSSTIKDMVDELREATEKALLAVDDDMDEDDGLTAAEIMNRRQVKASNISVPISRAGLREMEEHLSVERTLDEILNRAQLAVCRNIIWGASLDDQIWKPLQTDGQISNFIHSLGIRRYGNTLKYFANRVSGDPAFRVSGFFENSNLWGKVSFSDGLLDVRTNSFVERSLEDRVTAVLQYAYHDIALSPHYERLTEAMKALTVTENSYLRLQEFCGVALHAEPSGRILYFQHHNPRIASIFTKFIGKVWREDDVSFLGMRNFEQSFRSAQVLEHPIVISGKEGESSLRDISNILALVDGDGINADRKYLEPFDFVGRCSLICAGKNLPPLQKGSIGTFRYYLIRVNLTGDMSDGMSIRDILSMPKEFILWSLEGLRRFISNKGCFTFDEGSDIPREDASIVSFVEEMIVADLQGKIPSSVIFDAYSSYCTQHDMPALPKPRLIAYLKETYQIESRTIRVPWYNGGAPSFGYVGIRFSEAYQTLLTELSEDSSDAEQWNSTSYDVDEDEDEYEDVDDDSWYPDFQPSSELF